jgi:molybdopterin synthase catalytic subunit
MSMPATIRLQRKPFDIATEVAALTRGRSDIGAVVTFTGICRADESGEKISALTLEHYPDMAEAEIARHVEEARAGRGHRARCDGVEPPRRGVLRRRVLDGLSQNPRAILEAG